MAACDFKLGNSNDALNNLNETLKFQLSCEGKTYNVALTENLIQTVCRSAGNKKELECSIQRMKEMED